jgi:hypothetical protein
LKMIMGWMIMVFANLVDVWVKADRCRMCDIFVSRMWGVWNGP